MLEDASSTSGNGPLAQEESRWEVAGQLWRYGAIHIWELKSGEHVRTLRRDRPYERLTITGIRGLTQAEIATLRALGAVEDAAAESPGK